MSSKKKFKVYDGKRIVISKEALAEVLGYEGYGVEYVWIENDYEDIPAEDIGKVVLELKREEK